MGKSSRILRTLNLVANGGRVFAAIVIQLPPSASRFLCRRGLMRSFSLVAIAELGFASTREPGHWSSCPDIHLQTQIVVVRGRPTHRSRESEDRKAPPLLLARWWRRACTSRR